MWKMKLTTAGGNEAARLHMTGPDFVTRTKDWPAFQEEWRATFADYAKAA